MANDSEREPECQAQKQGNRTCSLSCFRQSLYTATSFILTLLGLTGGNPPTSSQIVHVRFGSTRTRTRFTAAFEDDEPDSADG
jgi:hypothetical protein